MAGSVSVESKLNQGTKFTISFNTNCWVNESDPSIFEIRLQEEDIPSPLTPKEEIMITKQRSEIKKHDSNKEIAIFPTQGRALPRLLLVNDNFSILWML